MKLLKSGLVGNIQVNDLKEQRKKVVSRWSKTGLLEGLNGSKKSGLAQLLENQAGQLLREAAGDSANSTANVAGFDIIVFPLVRRVFASLLANEIVSVQPMNLPTGLLFYLDHQVETTTTGDRGGFSSVYDAHYNNGGYDYSYGTGVTREQAQATVTANVATIPYSGGEKGLASLVVYGYSGSAKADSLSGTVAYTINPQTWTQGLMDLNTIAITVPVSGTLGAPVSFVHGTWTSTADLEAEANMAEVKLVITSTTVQARTRKMKASWTPEIAQDLAAYHSLDAEAELTSLLSEELAAEIDREIIRDLINIAPYETTWSYDRSASVTRTDGTVIAADPASAYITQKEWNQTLLTQVNKVSAQISKTMLRGGANWVMCSTEVGSVMQDIEKFHAVNDPDQMQFNMGIEKMGNLASQYSVYKDPWLPASICLIGRKGSNFMDTGYVYAPYVPFQLTPVVLDPNDLTPRKGIMTRYATKTVNNKYYGLVRVVFPDSYTLING